MPSTALQPRASFMAAPLVQLFRLVAGTDRTPATRMTKMHDGGAFHRTSTVPSFSIAFVPRCVTVPALRDAANTVRRIMYRPQRHTSGQLP